MTMDDGGDIELTIDYDELVHGVWCDICLLPSAITIPLFIADNHGRRIKAQPITVCLDHEPETTE